MNCDQAFEYLTDIRLARDPQLLRHLEHCRRCRQMKETLEPALALFDTAPSSPRQPPGLPALPAPKGLPAPERTAPAPESVQLARIAAIDLGARRRRDALRRSLRTLARAAALLLAGVAVGLALSPAPDPTPATIPAAAAGCTWLERPAPTAIEPTPRSVVTSCIGCHMSGPAVPRGSETRDEPGLSRFFTRPDQGVVQTDVWPSAAPQAPLAARRLS